jgi:hypothetical protein
MVQLLGHVGEFINDCTVSTDNLTQYFVILLQHGGVIRCHLRFSSFWGAEALFTNL